MGAFKRFTAQRLRSEQSGFTLIEVMMAAALLSVVLGAVLSLSQTGTRVAERDLTRANAIEEVQAGVARMDRELRTATQVFSPTNAGATNSVDFAARVSATGGGSRTVRRVRYSCDVPSPTVAGLFACYRYEGPVGSSPAGAGRLVIDQLVGGTPVFQGNAAPPTYFNIQIRRSAKGTLRDGYDYAITYEHGVYLRSVGGSL